MWGYTMAHGDRSVDVFVRKLPSKLQQASPDWCYIHTHFGVGYRFAAEHADDGVAIEVTTATDVAATIVAGTPADPRADPPTGAGDTARALGALV